jgi:hypothetical protein
MLYRMTDPWEGEFWNDVTQTISFRIDLLVCTSWRSYGVYAPVGSGTL